MQIAELLQRTDLIAYGLLGAGGLTMAAAGVYGVVHTLRRDWDENIGCFAGWIVAVGVVPILIGTLMLLAQAGTFDNVFR